MNKYSEDKNGDFEKLKKLLSEKVLLVPTLLIQQELIRQQNDAILFKLLCAENKVIQMKERMSLKNIGYDYTIEFLKMGFEPNSDFYGIRLDFLANFMVDDSEGQITTKKSNRLSKANALDSLKIKIQELNQAVDYVELMSLKKGGKRKGRRFGSSDKYHS